MANLIIVFFSIPGTIGMILAFIVNGLIWWQGQMSKLGIYWRREDD
jgi:hypothetical protein